MIKFIEEHKLEPFISDFFRNGKYKLTSLRGGLLNQNYVVTTKNKRFVLKVYRPEVTVEKAQEMFRVMEFAAKHGIPAPLPLATTVVDSFTVSMYEFINDDHPPRYRNSHARIKAMGEMLGRIHRALEGYKTTVPVPSLEKLTKQFVPGDSLKEINELRERSIVLSGARRREFGRVLDNYERIISKQNWNNVEFKKLPIHYIHGDFHIQNIFMKGDTITAVIDWEKSMWKFRCYEIMRSVIFNCRKTAGEFSWTLVEEYLKAYRSQIKISDIEAQYAFECGYRAVVFGFWTIRQYLLGHKNFRISMLRRREILQSMTKHRAEYAERIASFLL